MDEVLKRVWDNLIARFVGPLSFRLIVQPAVASILAIRAGRADAREGRPAFFWTALTDARSRRRLLEEGWKDVRTVFILAAVLDSIYQLIVHHGVHVLELLIVVTVLALVPYVLIRGPVNRIVRRRLIENQRNQSDQTTMRINT